MSEYNLSVVLLIPAPYKDAINGYAESIGWGPDNLSVELIHTDGSTWWGGHTAADEGFLDMLSNPPVEEGGPDPAPLLAALVVSAKPSDGNALGHWLETLADNGLTPVVVGEVLP